MVILPIILIWRITIHQIREICKWQNYQLTDCAQMQIVDLNQTELVQYHHPDGQELSRSVSRWSSCVPVTASTQLLTVKWLRFLAEVFSSNLRILQEYLLFFVRNDLALST